jgi:shikimate kinase
MFRPGTHLKRWVIVTVAAYAMVLHGLAMSAAAGEHDPAFGLQQICFGVAGTSETAPASPSAEIHAVPCALCGLGHAVLAVPEAVRVALPKNVIETIAQASTPEPTPSRLDRHNQARPRAPPAFV